MPRFDSCNISALEPGVMAMQHDACMHWCRQILEYPTGSHAQRCCWRSCVSPCNTPEMDIRGNRWHHRAARLSGNVDEYRRPNSIRRRSLRHDQKPWIIHEALEGEEDRLRKRDLPRDAFANFRKLKTSSTYGSTPIVAMDGTILSAKLARWKEHFSTLLNWPSISELQDIRRCSCSGDAGHVNPNRPRGWSK